MVAKEAGHSHPARELVESIAVLTESEDHSISPSVDPEDLTTTLTLTHGVGNSAGGHPRGGPTNESEVSVVRAATAAAAASGATSDVCVKGRIYSVKVQGDEEYRSKMMKSVKRSASADHTESRGVRRGALWKARKSSKSDTPGEKVLGPCIIGAMKDCRSASATCEGSRSTNSGGRVRTRVQVKMPHLDPPSPPRSRRRRVGTITRSVVSEKKGSHPIENVFRLQFPPPSDENVKHPMIIRRFTSKNATWESTSVGEAAVGAEAAVVCAPLEDDVIVLSGTACQGEAAPIPDTDETVVRSTGQCPVTTPADVDARPASRLVMPQDPRLLTLPASRCSAFGNPLSGVRAACVGSDNTGLSSEQFCTSGSASSPGSRGLQTFGTATGGKGVNTGGSKFFPVRPLCRRTLTRDFGSGRAIVASTRTETALRNMGIV